MYVESMEHTGYHSSNTTYDPINVRKFLRILIMCIRIYRRIPRLRPPFVHARIGQKWGGGLYAGSLHFRVTTITDRRMPRGRAISVLSLAVWWAKLEKNDKVRHIMTQIVSLLAVQCYRAREQNFSICTLLCLSQNI